MPASLPTLALTLDPVRAAMVAAGIDRMVAWPGRWARCLRKLDVAQLVDLVERQILIGGGLNWGAQQRLMCEAFGVDDRARGAIVARATIAGWADITAGRVTVIGRRPSWAPDDHRKLLDDWTDAGANRVLLLDGVEVFEPVVVQPRPDAGFWRPPAGLLGRLAPAAVAEAPAWADEPAADPAPIAEAAPRTVGELAAALSAGLADCGAWVVWTYARDGVGRWALRLASSEAIPIQLNLGRPVEEQLTALRLFALVERAA